MPLTGGQALKQAIHVARARTDMTSDMQLSTRAGVSYDTFMNWFGDKTVPRPHEVKKVADTLGIRYADLMAAWEGRPIDPPPLQDAIRELVEELRLSRVQQHEATLALLQAVGALVRGDPRPPERRAGTARAAAAGSDRG
jgi:lambda repressor-like predicted transcriptional regulator